MTTQIDFEKLKMLLRSHVLEPPYANIRTTMQKAADAIEQLQVENAELQEELRLYYQNP